MQQILMILRVGKSCPLSEVGVAAPGLNSAKPKPITSKSTTTTMMKDKTYDSCMKKIVKDD